MSRFVEGITIVAILVVSFVITAGVTLGSAKVHPDGPLILLGVVGFAVICWMSWLAARVG